MPIQDSRQGGDSLVGRLLGTLLENAPLLFHVKDDQGRYVVASRSWAESLGLERDSLIGRDDTELLPPELATLLRSHEKSVPHGPLFKVSEVELPVTDGIRHLLAWRFLIEDGPNGRSYLFMVAGDVSAQVQVRDALQVAVLAKARLLASACHDMRQPLQAAGLFLEVLKRRVTADKRAGEAASAATRALEAVERIMGELLMLSQLEAITEHPHPAPVKLADLMTELSAEFAPRAEAKGLRLHMVASSLTVASDAHLLARILRNLLSNAVTHTEKGKILFGCRRRPGGVEIQVLDTGPGIPPAEQETIFTEFHRLGERSLDSSSGFGLGLAIVARLAALLGHRIGLRSVPGSGSVFSVTVPLLAPTRGREPMPRPAERRRRTVLLIGGEARARKRLGSVLAQLGLDAEEAESLGALADVLARMPEAPLLVLAGRALPNGSLGTEAIAHVRARFGVDVSAVLVADRISAALRTAGRMARCRVARLPLSVSELSRLIAAGTID